MKLYLNSEDVKFSNGEILKTDNCLFFKQGVKSYVCVEDDYWILSEYLNMYYEYKKFKNYTANQFLNILNYIQKRDY